MRNGEEIIPYKQIWLHDQMNGLHHCLGPTAVDLRALACFLFQRMLWPGVQSSSSLEPAEPQIPTSVSSLPVLNASSCLCKACILLFIPKQSPARLPENSVCHHSAAFQERVCCAVDFLPRVMNLSSRKDGCGSGCVKTFLYGKV